MIETLIFKANILNILAGYYCEPDEEFFFNYEIRRIFVDNSEKIDSELGTYAKIIVDSLNNYSNLDLLREYTKIFLGPFDIIAHPYASVYLEGYTLNGEITQRILHFYNQCGLLFDEDVKDLPDNIVVMLQFLNYLFENEIQGNNDFLNIDWKSKRNEFVDLYIITWVPKFIEKIINGTQNEFYKKLALFTKKFFEVI